MPADLPAIIAILGPTCSWKSEVGARIAQDVGGEVVSCDSMQVYRDMDAGTAKPDASLLAMAPHHLVDILDISEPYNVSRFLTLATRLVDEIRGRGGVTVLVGGTGLYAKALLYGYDPLPADSAAALELERFAGTDRGRAELLDELVRATPAGLEAPLQSLRNPRRLVRAAEVLKLTGFPPWAHPGRGKAECRPDAREFVILPAMACLKPRIERRTAHMLGRGWVEETRRLVARGLLNTPTARQALGYADVALFLHEPPGTPVSTLCDELTRKTVRYARRQRTWFGNQHPAARVLRLGEPADCEALRANSILDAIRTDLGL